MNAHDQIQLLHSAYLIAVLQWKERRRLGGIKATQKWRRLHPKAFKESSQRTESKYREFNRKPKTCIPVEERFWSKVDKKGPIPKHDPQLGPCWVWTASRQKRDGYGQFNFNGRPALAHRLSAIFSGMRVPNYLFVCHKCDNKPCVNPNHFFIGTCLDNALDAKAKRLLRRRP